MRRLAVLGVALALVAGIAAGASASGPSPLDARQGAYREALVAARDALDPARPTEPARALHALEILRLGAPGEVDAIHLLEADPPQTIPARARIDSSLAAMDRAVDDVHPAASREQLRKILAQSRYRPDEGPLAFVGNLVVQLLRWLFQPGGGPLGWALVLLMLGVLALVALLLVPALRAPLRRGRDDRLAAQAGEGGIPQYFRVAEGLAARGDHAGAIRALVAGTMEMISGERSFTASPLTVRETFNRSGGGQLLRPLLMGFERSYYGHRETTESDYAAAAAAAHDYRQQAAHARAAA